MFQVHIRPRTRSPFSIPRWARGFVFEQLTGLDQGNKQISHPCTSLQGTVLFRLHLNEISISSLPSRHWPPFEFRSTGGETANRGRSGFVGTTAVFAIRTENFTAWNFAHPMEALKVAWKHDNFHPTLLACWQALRWFRVHRNQRRVGASSLRLCLSWLSGALHLATRGHLENPNKPQMPHNPGRLGQKFEPGDRNQEVPKNRVDHEHLTNLDILVHRPIHVYHEE